MIGTWCFITHFCWLIAQLVRGLPLANKADAGKSSMILAQWTWKPSPKAIGVDADEHGCEPIDEQKLKNIG